MGKVYHHHHQIITIIMVMMIVLMIIRHKSGLVQAWLLLGPLAPSLLSHSLARVSVMTALWQTFHRVGLLTLGRASPNSQAILKLDTNLNLVILHSQASLASSLELTLLNLELTLPPVNLDTQHLEQAT